MHSTTTSYIRNAVSLAFLYETRTILRLHDSIQFRSFSSTTCRYVAGIDQSQPRAQANKSNFLKAKAAASRAGSKGSNRSGTTITAAERRVFDVIFNQVAGEGPGKVTGGPREKRDTFIDHDEILSIFSSAVSNHVAEQKAQAEKQTTRAKAEQDTPRTLEDDEKIFQRYPRPLRNAARRAAAAAIGAEELGTLAHSTPSISTNAAGYSEFSASSNPENPSRNEDRETLDDLASRVVTNLAHNSKASEEPVPAGSNAAEDGQVDIQHKHTPSNSGQTHLNKEVGPSTDNGNVTPGSFQLPGHRSSYSDAEKDEATRQETHPSAFGSGGDVEEGDGSHNLHVRPTGLRPSFLTAHRDRSHLHPGFRPSFLTVEKRVEDVASFAEHYGAVRPSFIRRAEDAAVVKERLRHDPESVFQGTVHRYCHEEMGKLADSFQKAMKVKGDVGIWNDCLSRVFPMIELLDASLRDEKLSQRTRVDAPTTRKPPSQVSKADAVKASTMLPRPESPLPDIPPYVPPLYVISRLYPAALLLAFRLLKTRFPTSPLSLALLPQIRSLGPTSYVLGASTEFYNALIELRWEVYSDLKSIDGLLMEMERSGVVFGIGTWNTLVKIGSERFNDLHDADGGSRGAAFWGRAHNVTWFQKVGVEWKMVIAARLREQGLGAEISEREYGGAGLPETGQAGAEQGTVWL